jgi:hypothetical protein
MNAQPTTIRIESIIFDNTDTKVLIKGETFKNHLSYASEMFISFNELNVLLNHLQVKNPTIVISDLLEEEFFGEYQQTILDVEQLENSQVNLSFLSSAGTKKLIRA